jgi:tetraprenyl-beta-curcumene synthase
MGGSVAVQDCGALGRAVSRELLWSFPAVSRHVAGWQALASGISDATLRRDALFALIHKRAHIDGAALFATLPTRRDPDLLRALVAFEIIGDYLDCLSERSGHLGVDPGLRLHMALMDALSPAVPLRDYYRDCPWREDNAYLHTLVAVCRVACQELPSFTRVWPAIASLAAFPTALVLNHEPDPLKRVRLLRQWTKLELPREHGRPWFEAAASATGMWITVHALLALAAERTVADEEVMATREVYARWVSLAATMLDSYADIADDQADSFHSYVGYYHSVNEAAVRVGEIVRSAVAEVRSLFHGERHTVIVRCMTAMYLSKDSVRTGVMRPHTRVIASASGPLTRSLLPVLRLWRIAHRLQAA